MNKFMQKGKFRTAQGEITVPENSGLRLVLNPVDLSMKLVLPMNKQLTSKWAKPRESAKSWMASREKFVLGEVQSVAVQSDVWVMNMLVLDAEGALNKDALASAVKKVVATAKAEQASLHVNQNVLEMGELKSLLQTEAIENGVNVYLYHSK